VGGVVLGSRTGSSFRLLGTPELWEGIGQFAGYSWPVGFLGGRTLNMSSMLAMVQYLEVNWTWQLAG